MTQKRNDELVNNLRPDFFARSEPNASWVHYQSAIMSTCALKGFWPMSILHWVNPNIYVHDAAVDHDLELINGPVMGYMTSATQTALPPWIFFNSANSQYLTHNLDDAQHDITGTEAYVFTNEQGLTLGGWFRFATVPASIFGLIGKWYNVANQLGYVLYKTAGNLIRFSVTTDGVTQVSVDSAQTISAGVWYHLYGRFDPSTDLSVFVDGVKTTNAVGTPASVFNSNEPLQIGRADRTHYLNGYASMVQLNAAQLTDSIIKVLYEQSRVMYSK